MLHPKETVIDHHRGQSGGQPVQVVYNFQGGVTEADLGRALPMLVQRTKREVVDAVQRGGGSYIVQEVYADLHTDRVKASLVRVPSDTEHEMGRWYSPGRSGAVVAAGYLGDVPTPLHAND